MSAPAPSSLAAPSRAEGANPWADPVARAAHPAAANAEALLSTIAEGIAAASAPWPDPPAHAAHERGYELLLATPLYDVWLIFWPPGSGLEPHDHGGSSGAFAVVDGILDEERTTDGVTVRRRTGRGGSVRFGPGHIHAVANTTERPATSVHVYAPPLRSMSFYRTDASRRLVVDRVDEVGTTGP